jgi:AhpD family alkylhydroperoxidase
VGEAGLAHKGFSRSRNEVRLHHKERRAMSVMQKYKPDLFNKWSAFATAAFEEGTLSAKHKELMAIALSIAASCEPCVKIHTRRAKKLGATNEEIAETLAVAVVMLGGPSDVWPRDTSMAALEKTA